MPNHIRLSSHHFLKVSLLQLQYRPLGGKTLLPDGVVISYSNESEPDFADNMVDAQGPLGSLSGFEYPRGISALLGRSPIFQALAHSPTRF